MRILVTQLLISKLDNDKAQDLKIKKLLNQDEASDTPYTYIFRPFKLDLDKVSGFKETENSEKLYGKVATDIIMDGVFLTIGVTPDDFFKYWTAGMDVINIDKNLNELKDEQ